MLSGTSHAIAHNYPIHHKNNCRFCCRSFRNLQYFPSLQTLVLDKNNLEDVQECPVIPTLTTLWFNNNRVWFPCLVLAGMML